MKKRKYPSHLYPNKRYKKITYDFSLGDHFLLRYTKEDVPLDKGEQLLGKHMCASRFFNGCSTNLLSRYRKTDARFIVKGTANSPQHEDWNEGDSCYNLREIDFQYNKKRGYIGIKISDLLGVCIDKRPIVVNGIKIREDKVFLKIEHAPTKCNFWHFNIVICGINSKTGKEYKLKDQEGYTNTQMTKVATDLIHKLEPYLVRPEKMKKKYLPKNKYIKPY